MGNALGTASLSNRFYQKGLGWVRKLDIQWRTADASGSYEIWINEDCDRGSGVVHIVPNNPANAPVTTRAFFFPYGSRRIERRPLPQEYLGQ